MECPYCHKPLTTVTNSRPTQHNSQIWRRRECLNCGEIFTTHELIDLSHLDVIKKSGQAQRYSRMKLYSGIFYSAQASKIPDREVFVDKITREIEAEILGLKKNKITSSEIADLVLKILKKRNMATFLRFLTYCKNITNEVQMNRELAKYTSDN